MEKITEPKKDRQDNNSNNNQRPHNHHNNNRKKNRDRKGGDDKGAKKVDKNEPKNEKKKVTAPEPVPQPQEVEYTPEETAAAIEDLKEWVKASKQKKPVSTEQDKVHTPEEDWEKYLDMDVRTGLSYESDKISSNIFLTRGLNDLPEPEKVNCRQYDYASCKLPSYDWINKLNISFDYIEFPIAEVRFKNSHKDFFLLPPDGVFKVGDIVAVEASTGHDIGVISMLGLQVKRQLEHKRVKASDVTKKLYRTARYADIEEWIATVGLEHETMLKSRYTAWDLDLKMKVNDVEYQGDGTKAIFYYSAEERVDFRELIKILAEQFHIRIEMRQIGVRQEAARLGGLGSCGRELCCSSWLTNFQSVSTNTARTQQLSLNPQKLAGMCGKLKCCLNFEQDTYIRELKEFPASNVQLKTKKGRGIYNKIDIFKKMAWYSYADDSSTIFALPLEKVKMIIKMNESGKQPETLEEFAVVNQKKVEEGNNYSMDELKHIADS